jgi:hypothetical protein
MQRSAVAEFGFSCVAGWPAGVVCAFCSVGVVRVALCVTQHSLGIVPIRAVYNTHATDGYQQIPLKHAR